MTTDQPLRIGIVCDLLEEQWPSMDLVADELMRTLPSAPDPHVQPERIRPRMPSWTRAVARVLGGRAALNANRYLDRHHRYPRWLREHRPPCDAFHVVDHTYAHLVHELPARRTVVTCHDVDAFRCLIDPAKEPRSAMFRAMTRRVLDGLQRAAVVTCDSEATRRALVDNGLRRDGLEVVPLGVHAAFTPRDDVSEAGEPPMLLHVGSTIPRKRMDVLLEVFARIRVSHPAVRLVQVGGDFTRRKRPARAPSESWARSR